MELVTRATELLNSIEYINIASVSDSGMPWNTPVYAKFDKHLNFYWSSWTEAEHSKNIKANPEVFITIYDSTRKRGDNNRRCLFVKAQAFELFEEELISQGINLLYKNDIKIPELGEYLGNAIKRIYIAKPNKFWLNDKSEREVTLETIKMRVEVPTEDLISKISSL